MIHPSTSDPDRTDAGAPVPVLSADLAGPDASPATGEAGKGKAGARPSSAQGLFAMAGVALAAFAATLSAVGLAVTSRTVVEARAAIDALRAVEQRHADRIGGAPSPATATRVALIAPPAPAAASAPDDAAIAQMRRSLDALREDVARLAVARNGGAMLSTVSDGQAELANRLGVINNKLDRIERAISSSHVAMRADDRARPF